MSDAPETGTITIRLTSAYDEWKDETLIEARRYAGWRTIIGRVPAWRGDYVIALGSIGGRKFRTLHGLR